MYRPVLMGLAIAALLISALAATSYPVHAALSAHAAIGSNTAVPAAPSNLTAQAVGATSVQLTWTNSASNQSGVVISRDGEESVDLQGATVSSYTWNGLSPNTKYWFYVASKIYGTPGDPTGYGNTQSAWVGPVYATTVGTQPSTSAAQQPPTAGSGVPTTLPTQPSPTFVCVTGPGGSCLQPVPQTWTPTVPGW
jgi:fibronectin type III domain protein